MAVCIAPLAIVALGVAAVLPPTASGAAQAPVGLGAVTSFAVLSGAGITNAGATTIYGDVGAFPTSSETGFDTVTLNGTDHAGDAVTQQAKQDLVTAFDTAFGAKPVNAVPTELGGSTLVPGVYNSQHLGITGTLTLDTQGDPDAVFIFQASSTLITASASRVIFLNGATTCHVYWQLGSSATLGTNSRLIGTVMAHTAIAAQTGATIQGRLLARTASVTLHNNTITRPVCAAAATTTTAGGGSGGTTTPGGGATSTTLPRGGRVVVAPTTTVPGAPGTGTPGTPGSGTPGAPGTPGSGTPTPHLPETL